MKDKKHSFHRYLERIQCRIVEQAQNRPTLDALIVKRKRININNSGLSYRISNELLVPHQYTTFIDVTTKNAKNLN